MNSAANNQHPIQRLLQLNFLGGFSASIDGVPLTDFPYDKVRALLAYLVMEPAEHSRERLAELLWPDLDGEKARGNLRRCLFDLRRALGDSAAATSHDFIVGGMRTLRFNFAAPYRLDVEEFIAADSVAPEPSSVRELRTTLYRGPFLAGLSLPDAPEFDVWMIAKREALHRSALAQLEQLIAYSEQRNEFANALECAQRAIDIDFWRESLQRAYLRLLARNSQAAALAHFDNFRRALSDDLGVSPEKETLALVESIRRGELTVSVEQIPVAGRAERRRLVALVCDIELRGYADPEEAIARLSAPLAACAAMMAARRGYVASSLGGELQVFFGYPAASESAPRDAADAALALVEYLSGETGLMFRIGLHAGWCYASASGDTPDETGLLFKSARRLALDTPEGRIAVSAELRRIIGGYFRFEPRPDIGNAAVFLSGKSRVSRRIDLFGSHLPTLVGRQSELAKLSILWGDVRMGKRRSVLLGAEPGIGKSRLAAAMAQQAALLGGNVCEFACQPEAMHTPYYPLIQGLLREIGDDENEAAELRRQKAANFLKKLRLDADAAEPVLSQLLGIPRSEVAQNETVLPPAERKQKEDALLAELFGRLGRGKPLLLIVEDIHWADQSTLEFLARVLAADGVPTMLLLTSRHAPPQAIADKLTVEIALTPLTEEATQALIEGLLGEQKISASVLATIVSRADGVPLYAEELARSMLAAPREEIPATLWDILAARLDSLGAAKRIAQQAAAVGREFSTELLQAIGENNQHLADGLDAMLHAGLVQSFPAGQYRFRHSLIRDAAYQSITLAERRLIHRDVAAALRGNFAEQVATHPEMLARHLSAAGDPAAAEVWLEAGTYAAAHSANNEAIHDFNAGLDILKLLPEGDAYRMRSELRLQVALGAVLIAVEGYGSVAAKLCYTRAWALSEQASEDRDLFPVMWGLWQGGRSGDDGLSPLELAHRLARMAGNSPDPAVRIAVDYAYGNNYYWVGEFDLARRHLESAIRLADKVPSALLIARYGEDVGIFSRAILSWVCWIQGDPDGARRNAEESIALARQLGHAHSLGFVMSIAAVLYRISRQPEQVAAISRELLAHADKHGLLLWQAVAAAHLGWTLAVAGKAEGLEPIRQGVAGARIAMPAAVSSFLSILADALALLRRPAEVLEVIAEARHEVEKIQDTYYVPELIRLQGEAMLQLDPACAAEAGKLFAQALKQAEASGAHQLALRCATSFARQHLAAGQKSKAKKLITQALGRVHGDPSNPDIYDANQLLVQLA